METVPNVVVDASAHRVVLRGDLDIGTVDEIRDALTEWLGDDEAITMNLRDVTFVDSTGVKLFLDLMHEGRRLTLVHVPDAVMQLFAMMRLTSHDGIEIVALAS